MVPFKVGSIDENEFVELGAESALIRELGGELVRWSPGSDIGRMVVDADVVLTGETETSAAMIAGMEKCLALVCFGIGFDHVDIDAATEAGICVVNHPGVWTDEVSTHALALMLAFSRQIVASDAVLRDRTGWTNAATAVMGAAAVLRGATLGIVGFGRIGRMVARKAEPFGLRLLVCDPYIDPEAPKEYGGALVSLEELLKQADFVSVHTPLTKETFHLMGEEQFRIMKPGAVFINTARGRVHDEGALLQALEEKWIAGAGLDVFEVEPPTADNPLFGRPDVIATPHSAFYSSQSVAGLHERVAKAIRDSLEGRLPYNVANPAVIGRSRIERRGEE